MGCAAVALPAAYTSCTCWKCLHLWGQSCPAEWPLSTAFIYCCCFEQGAFFTVDLILSAIAVRQREKPAPSST